MFLNDRLNVRGGNARRKKALMRAAAKAQALGGYGNRAGGGLGKSRFQSRLGFKAPGLAAAFLGLGLGGGQGELNNLDDPFMQAEVQPGAYDPGAQDAASDLQLRRDPAGPVRPVGQGGGSGYQPGYGSLPAAVNAGAANEDGTSPYIQGAQQAGLLPGQQAGAAGGAAPAGYVWYQGQLIPTGVWNAMQAQGGF